MVPGIGKPLGPRSEAAVEILALAAVVLLAGLPVLAGRPLGGHDVAAYLAYAQQTAANLREGVLLPAWASDLNGGFGGPGLLFYPPLVNTLHALLPLAGLPLATGLGALALGGKLLSGLALRGWLRAAGFREGALGAAILYVAAPYRVVDLYERGTLAEHWAFVLPPLLLWIGSEERLAPARRAALGAVVVAALALTNLPLLVLFGAALGPLVLVLPSTRSSIGPFLLAAPLGLALSAFSLGPQALASRWMRVELWFGDAGANAFRPSTNTLFNAAAMDAAFNRRVSLALLATLLVGLASVLLTPPERRRRVDARAWLVLLVVAFAVTLGPFGPVWDAAPVLSKLQFPWRVGALLTLAAAALVALLPRGRAVLVALAGALLAAPQVGVRTLEPPPPYRPSEPGPPARAFPDPRAVREAAGEEGSWVQRGLWDYWYVPRTAPRAFFVEMTGGRAPELDAIRARPALLSGSPGTPVDVVAWGRLDKEVSLRAPRAGVLLWHVLAFPGMSVAVDGRSVPLLLDRTTGLVAAAVPAGPHTVSWSWRPFPPLVAFRGVSAIALLGTLLLLGLPAATRRAQSSRGRPGAAAGSPVPPEVRDKSS